MSFEHKIKLNMDSVNVNQPSGSSGDKENNNIIQKYEAIMEDYESIRHKYGVLMTSHSETVHKLRLVQEELNQLKEHYDEITQERYELKQQCRGAIMKLQLAVQQINEYKEVLAELNQQQEEAIKDRMESNLKMQRLTEQRDAALKEISLILSERDSVHGEIEKLEDNLASTRNKMDRLEKWNKELVEKFAEAAHEAEVSKKRRDWAFSERDRVVRECQNLQISCDELRKERDKVVEAFSGLQMMSKLPKRDSLLSSSLGPSTNELVQISARFTESRDSAIDSDSIVPFDSGYVDSGERRGHCYNVQLPIFHGVDHGLVLETGVYISRIIPGSPAAAKFSDSNCPIGDRILAINNVAIQSIQDAIMALSRDTDPPILFLTLLPCTSGHSSSSHCNPANINKGRVTSMSGFVGKSISMNDNSSSCSSLDLSVKSGTMDQITLDRFRMLLRPTVNPYAPHHSHHHHQSFSDVGLARFQPSSMSLTPSTLRFPAHHHYHQLRSQGGSSNNCGGRGGSPSPESSRTTPHTDKMTRFSLGKKLRNKLANLHILHPSIDSGSNSNVSKELNLAESFGHLKNMDSPSQLPFGSAQDVDSGGNGVMRRVQIDKSNKPREPLGIQISCKAKGSGVFVSSVTKNSPAHEIGLQIGDQLLEVCGINLRCASYSLAANLLSNCGDIVTMLVQYCPDKYTEECLQADDPIQGSDNEEESDSSSSSSKRPCSSVHSMTLVRKNSKHKAVVANSETGGQGPSDHNQVTQFLNERGNLTISGTVRQLCSDDDVYVWEI